MSKHRKIDSRTEPLDGYGNDFPPLGGYVGLIGTLQMWRIRILAALLELRELEARTGEQQFYGH